ncbi:MAG: peptidyl-prolyl cis-trans isomerase [Candidatus Omnitrophica bacterium]|nr:peptidyl-prolyl cis-trans isomerase [Candidatus Omnitrophota bacterium]
MRIFCISIFVCLACLSFCACDKVGLKSEDAGIAARDINGPLLVQVNDWKMGLEDFEKRLKTLEPLAKQQNLDINSYEFKARVLRELVRTALLAQEAKARKLGEEKGVIEAMENYRQNLMAQKLIINTVKDISVTDVEIENFYNQNTDYFKTPEQVKVREIVVNDESEARNLYIRLLQGEDFSALAQKYSVVASKDKAGDLGYITYDINNKFRKFWDAVSALDKGEVSSIFKSDDGKFYIVKLDDKKEATTSSLSQVKENIRNALRVDKQNKAVNELVNVARQKAKVVINEDLLK